MKKKKAPTTYVTFDEIHAFGLEHSNDPTYGYMAAGFCLGLTCRAELGLTDEERKMLAVASITLKRLLDETAKK